MHIVNKVLGFLFSTRLTGFLLLLFAASMAIATFIENDYGTETSKALVYSAKWFEIVMVLLAINFLGNIAKYNLFSVEKAPVFLLHIAFVIIILGAGITRYRGYEALVTIKENQSIQQVLSIDSFLQVEASDTSSIKKFPSKLLMMSKLGGNYLNEAYNFKNKEVNIQLKEYLPNAAYVLEDTPEGDDYLHLVIAEESQRKDLYIKRGERETFFGTSIAFDTPAIKGDIFITRKDGVYKVKFPEVTDYFSMLENKSSFYPKDSLVTLKFKALSTFNKIPLVFNEVLSGKTKKLIQKKEDRKVKNPESALVLKISSGAEEKEISLLGGKGYINPKTTLYINGMHLKLGYGSKPIGLPFSLKLNDFVLERYPGSDSPSAFYSYLELTDKGKTSKHKIFMNNVLDYGDFRFFQSAYLPDESGTILSVNHDSWGTLVTYIGYAMLALGMVLSLIWKTKRVQKFFKNQQI